MIFDLLLIFLFFSLLIHKDLLLYTCILNQIGLIHTSTCQSLMNHTFSKWICIKIQSISLFAKYNMLLIIKPHQLLDSLIKPAISSLFVWSKERFSFNLFGNLGKSLISTSSLWRRLMLFCRWKEETEWISEADSRVVF